ncbi:hypothetical protein ACQPZ2_20535 [Nocardia pseudovaccinii]|uniref:hypothetical protein n=1 Tax=Nocardia pseudovaccinii TaxID=189540 RepID=UPI003D8A3210
MRAITGKAASSSRRHHAAADEGVGGDGHTLAGVDAEMVRIVRTLPNLSNVSEIR